MEIKLTPVFRGTPKEKMGEFPIDGEAQPQ
jgi:hypothetical protein